MEQRPVFSSPWVRINTATSYQTPFSVNKYKLGSAQIYLDCQKYVLHFERMYSFIIKIHAHFYGSILL